VRKSAGILLLLSIGAAGAASAWAQAADDAGATQTARQALVEMFWGKTPGTFAKHLPAATLIALANSGMLTSMQQYSLLASQLQASGKHFEMFETGSLLLVAEDPQSGQKFEVKVDKDSLRGDQDDIELSFQTYKDKQPQTIPYLPRMTFGMKKESGIWKLNEIQITVRVPLADPAFLKGMTDAMKARGAMAGAASMQPTSHVTTPVGSDASVLAAVQSILQAENAYSASYRAVGYTCTLSDLDGFGGGAPNEHQAMLIPSGLASGKKYGYVFTLSGCTGSPATSFHLVAAPAMNNLGRRALCSDQSGAIRSSADGNAASCIGGGVPVQ
jgi:hypothetical protein